MKREIKVSCYTTGETTLHGIIDSDLPIDDYEWEVFNGINVSYQFYRCLDKYGELVPISLEDEVTLYSTIPERTGELRLDIITKNADLSLPEIVMDDIHKAVTKAAAPYTTGFLY